MENGCSNCLTPCQCPEPWPVNNAIISLIKFVRQKTLDQKDYLKADDDELWTLKLESPFPHYWTFGFTKQVPIFNLTTPNEAKITFGSGRFAIVYDYEFETMVTLEGHKNTIKCLALDSSGRFLASCDGDVGNKIILWDLKEFSPIHVIYDFENTPGPVHVWLSPCAQRIIALIKTKTTQELHVFHWMSTREDAKIRVILDPHLGAIEKLIFSPDNPEFFAATTEKRVVFFTFVPESKSKPSQIRAHNGQFEIESTIGNFTDSTYLGGTHLCYSSTETGHIRVWSDLDYYDGLCDEKPVSNFKNEITYVHISSTKISTITAVGSYVVVANDFGKIKFFTYTLILMYCFEHEELNSIISLSFNILDRDESYKDMKICDKKRANTLFVLGQLCRKKKRRVENWQELADARYILPRNLEDEPELFSVKDCVVYCKNERVAYVNFVNRSVEYLLENFVSDVVALECHPLRNYLVLVTANGFLYMIDYVINQEIVHRSLLPLNVTTGGAYSVRGTASCLKYSVDGKSLVCGLTNGHLVFLSPLMLEAVHVAKYTDRSIRIIRFSPDATFLAICDTTNIFFIDGLPNNPRLIAMQKTHGRVITDVLFFTKTSGDVTCFSIGKDKNIVEYDIDKTFFERKVSIKKCVRVEQRSDPLCLSLSPNRGKMIMSKSDFKLQIINVDQLVYTSNKHAPVLMKPVNKLQVLNSMDSQEYLFFTACNHIGMIKLPLEGNPFKWISVHVSQNKISQYVLSKDTNFVFTLSKDEGLVQMWRILPRVLEVLASNVGDEEAFKYENIFGPDRDFLLKELKDYFVYAHINHRGIASNDPIVLQPSIPVCEVPDVLRAMGCFMTNYEMECAIRKGEPREKFKIEERKICFTELVELYASNRELSCVKGNEIKKAFRRICSMKTTGNAIENRTTISRNDFVHLLTSKGETMPICEALHFLRTLVDPLNKEKAKVDLEKQKLADRNEQDQSVDFMFLPETITYDYFVRNILGLTDKPHDIKVNWYSEQELLKDVEGLRQKEEESKMLTELAYRQKFAELGFTKGSELVVEDICVKNGGK